MRIEVLPVGTSLLRSRCLGSSHETTAAKETMLAPFFHFFFILIDNANKVVINIYIL